MLPSHVGLSMHKEEVMATPGTMVSLDHSPLALGAALEFLIRGRFPGEHKEAYCSSARTPIRHVELLSLRPQTPRCLWSIKRPCHKRACQRRGPQRYMYVVPQSSSPDPAEHQL